MLEADLLCEKFKLYGFNEVSVGWFTSFLTGRRQRVKIGGKISSSIDLESGVPQGGILSIFVVYVSDDNEWLLHTKAITYADDTRTSTNGKTITEINSHDYFRVGQN